MKRGESIALALTALALCGICAWAVHALLRPGSVLALAGLMSLC
ncbi:hypothetical protein IP92_05112 [Pseudoduganella flava]|uniref:Uncharacterized protein n=1 Tax=Pseudoduganella flava TaxID=871742 RepID=A0A562PGI3_9BURK|nr:hypothetical protein IP92_05112 [Pseudoduganella flava]